MPRFKLIAAALALSPLVCHAQQILRYRATIVDSSGLLLGFAISPNGQITGVRVTLPLSDAFLIRKGTFTGFGAPAGGTTEGYAVNNSGVVVGEQWGPSGDVPFIADPVHGLRTFSPLGGSYGIAHGINNDGVVVGVCNAPRRGGEYLPFKWQHGVGAALPLPPGMVSGGASAVTDSGLIVGQAWSEPDGLPVAWVNGTPRLLSLPAGFTTGFASAASDTGWIAGVAVDRVLGWLPVVWHNEVPTLLPTLGGAGFFVQGVSASGQVIGFDTRPPNGADARAMTWIDGQAYDLNQITLAPRGLYLFWAEGIDSQGRILVDAIQNSMSVVVLLTPMP